jgi:hypothetical protein
MEIRSIENVEISQPNQQEYSTSLLMSGIPRQIQRFASSHRAGPGEWHS